MIRFQTTANWLLGLLQLKCQGFTAASGVILYVCLSGWDCLAEEGQDNHGQFRTLPLASIYTTSGQAGLKHLSAGVVGTDKNGVRKYREPYGYDLAQLQRMSPGMGASNVLLVQGKDITAAIKAAAAVFMGGRSADVPASPQDGVKSSKIWLVAYFGRGNIPPPAWVVKSVEQKGRNLRVSFAEPEPEAGGWAIRQYLVWVPLGELEPGVYTLELFNVTAKTAVLTRRVTVPR